MNPFILACRAASKRVAETGKYRSLSSVSSIDLVVVALGGSPQEVTSRSTSGHSISQQFDNPQMSVTQLQASSRYVIHHHQQQQQQQQQQHPPGLSFEESCKGLVTATRSRASVFLEAHPDHLDEAFRKATASINKGTSFAGNRLQRALTMQKF